MESVGGRVVIVSRLMREVFIEVLLRSELNGYFGEEYFI